MIKTAGFHVIKTLDDFVWKSEIELPAELTCEYTESLAFIKAKENLIFMDALGMYKTHPVTAMALKTCQEGHKVRFFYDCFSCKSVVGAQQQGYVEQIYDRNEKGRDDRY